MKLKFWTIYILTILVVFVICTLTTKYLVQKNIECFFETTEMSTSELVEIMLSKGDIKNDKQTY